MRPLRAAVGAVVLTAVLAACGGGDGDGVEATPVSNTNTTAAPKPAVPVREVDVTVNGGDEEFTFDTDLTSIEAGTIRVSLTNDGAEDHQAMLLRFAPGADLAAFAAAAATDPSGITALGLVEGFGGPNGVAPGATGSATSVVEPGEYMLICVMPGADGVPHAAKGMVRPFTVTEADGEAAALDDGDDHAEVTLVDFGFVGDRDFAAGETVRVTNRGKQGHELVAYRLDEGAAVDDVLDAIDDPASGPPPMTAAAGLGIVAPGREAEFAMPDEAGSYVLLCFLPNVTGGAHPEPHHDLGMAAGVSVS